MLEEMQIKTTMRCHLTPVRMAIIKNHFLFNDLVLCKHHLQLWKTNTNSIPGCEEGKGQLKYKLYLRTLKLYIYSINWFSGLSCINKFYKHVLHIHFFFIFVTSILNQVVIIISCWEHSPWSFPSAWLTHASSQVTKKAIHGYICWLSCCDFQPASWCHWCLPKSFVLESVIALLNTLILTIMVAVIMLYHN